MTAFDLNQTFHDTLVETIATTIGIVIDFDMDIFTLLEALKIKTVENTNIDLMQSTFPQTKEYLIEFNPKAYHYEPNRISIQSNQFKWDILKHISNIFIHQYEYEHHEYQTIIASNLFDFKSTMLQGALMMPRDDMRSIITQHSLKSNSIDFNIIEDIVKIPANKLIIRAKLLGFINPY